MSLYVAVLYDDMQHLQKRSEELVMPFVYWDPVVDNGTAANTRYCCMRLVINLSLSLCIMIKKYLRFTKKERNEYNKIRDPSNECQRIFLNLMCFPEAFLVYLNDHINLFLYSLFDTHITHVERTGHMSNAPFGLLQYEPGMYDDKYIKFKTELVFKRPFVERWRQFLTQTQRELLGTFLDAHGAMSRFPCVVKHKNPYNFPFELIGECNEHQIPALCILRIKIMLQLMKEHADTNTPTEFGFDLRAYILDHFEMMQFMESLSNEYGGVNDNIIMLNGREYTASYPIEYRTFTCDNLMDICDKIININYTTKSSSKKTDGTSEYLSKQIPLSCAVRTIEDTIISIIEGKFNTKSAETNDTSRENRWDLEKYCECTIFGLYDNMSIRTSYQLYQHIDKLYDLYKRRHNLLYICLGYKHCLRHIIREGYNYLIKNIQYFKHIIDRTWRDLNFISFKEYEESNIRSCDQLRFFMIGAKNKIPVFPSKKMYKSRETWVDLAIRNLTDIYANNYMNGERVMRNDSINAAIYNIINFPALGFLSNHFRYSFYYIFRWMYEKLGISRRSFHTLLECVNKYINEDSIRKTFSVLSHLENKDRDIIHIYLIKDKKASEITAIQLPIEVKRQLIIATYCNNTSAPEFTRTIDVMPFIDTYGHTVFQKCSYLAPCCFNIYAPILRGKKVKSMMILSLEDEDAFDFELNCNKDSVKNLKKKKSTKAKSEKQDKIKTIARRENRNYFNNHKSCSFMRHPYIFNNLVYMFLYKTERASTVIFKICPVCGRMYITELSDGIELSMCVQCYSRKPTLYAYDSYSRTVEPLEIKPKNYGRGYRNINHYQRYVIYLDPVSGNIVASAFSEKKMQRYLTSYYTTGDKLHKEPEDYFHFREEVWRSMADRIQNIS